MLQTAMQCTTWTVHVRLFNIRDIISEDTSHLALKMQASDLSGLMGSGLRGGVFLECCDRNWYVHGYISHN